MSAKHTPEPWKAKQLHPKGNPNLWAVYGPPHPVDGGDYAPISQDWMSEANARRIVAAVNACAGQSTEDLEAGFAAGWEPMPQADARHIAACFNACRGIPVSALEAGVVMQMRGHLLFAIRRFRWPLAERLAARTALASTSVNLFAKG